MDQAAERYLKKLRRALVCPKKDKERLLADARDLLENFAQENPRAFYQDYVLSFGQPEDFAGEMLSNLDPEDVREARLRRKRTLMAMAVAVAAMLVLLAGIWLGQRSQSPAEIPTPVPTVTPAPEVTPTPEPTAEATPEPTSTPEPTPGATPEPTPAPEPTATPASGPVTLVESQFTDYVDIAYKEAVGTVVALKIMNGKEDGTYFDPAGNITRGEAAKIIAVIMNGGSEANTGVKQEPTFSDIQGHWAEGYIEYCADMGLVGPWESEEFDPYGAVTSIELLRMCLGALGYDAVAYNLMGESWQVQTLELARKVGGRRLTEGLDDVVMVEPVTRDVAAQIFYNTLRATVVTVHPSVRPGMDEVIWEFRTEDNPTFLKQRFDKELTDIVYEYPDF